MPLGAGEERADPEPAGALRARSPSPRRRVRGARTWTAISRRISRCTSGSTRSSHPADGSIRCARSSSRGRACARATSHSVGCAASPPAIACRRRATASRSSGDWIATASTCPASVAAAAPSAVRQTPPARPEPRRARPQAQPRVYGSAPARGRRGRPAPAHTRGTGLRLLSPLRDTVAPLHDEQRGRGQLRAPRVAPVRRARLQAMARPTHVARMRPSRAPRPHWPPFPETRGIGPGELNGRPVPSAPRPTRRSGRPHARRRGRPPADGIGLDKPEQARVDVLDAGQIVQDALVDRRAARSAARAARPPRAASGEAASRGEGAPLQSREPRVPNRNSGAAARPGRAQLLRQLGVELHAGAEEQQFLLERRERERSRSRARAGGAGIAASNSPVARDPRHRLRARNGRQPEPRGGTAGPRSPDRARTRVTALHLRPDELDRLRSRLVLHDLERALGPVDAYADEVCPPARRRRDRTRPSRLCRGEPAQRC